MFIEAAFIEIALISCLTALFVERQKTEHLWEIIKDTGNAAMVNPRTVDLLHRSSKLGHKAKQKETIFSNGLVDIHAK